VTKTYADNADVVFMDVNLSEESIRESPDGDPYNPGAGGWPTIRYFNKETGIAGGSYEKKTDGAMCDELGDEAMMEAYVEEYGNTSLCSLDGKGCSEKELAFIEKSKVMSSDDQRAQLDRLMSMQDKPMKPELLSWVKKRQKILKQLVAAGAGASDEL
jgi:hypothetical protein